jgi:putative transposase
LHAYVLMDNHYHLLLEIRRANLSRSIQWLNVSYSVWFNRRHGRSGHLLQGRFKSVALDPQAWGLGLSAYIHLNPVRTAALDLCKIHRQRARAVGVDRPDQSLVQQRLQILRGYRWSSYRAFVGGVRPPVWLDCAGVLELGGGSANQKQANYRNYVENQVREGLAKSPWEELTDRTLLGGATFLRKVRASLQMDARLQRAPKSLRQPLSFGEVIAAVEKVRKGTWEEFRERHGDRGRDQALYLARRATSLTLSELAKAAGLNQHASVAVAIKRYEKDAKKNPAERRFLKQAADLLEITM